MTEKFYVKLNNGYYLGLKHYEGVTKVIYNILYDIAKENPYGKIIPENYMIDELNKLLLEETHSEFLFCKLS